MAQAPDIFHNPTPEAIEASAMTAFTRHCQRLTGRTFPTYGALHRWSVASPEAFWAAWLAWSGLIFDGDPEPALVGEGVEAARFFPGLSLSYTENLLGGARCHRSPEALAVTACDETGRIERLSWAELVAQTEAMAHGLRGLGVGRGHRVAAVVRNAADAIVACLAATGLGATWSSVAPDMGFEAILDRFAQLRPQWLVAHTTQTHSGQQRNLTPLIEGLAETLPTLKGIIILDKATNASVSVPCHARSALSQPPPRQMCWPRVAFDHPLFILFSSGTTGPPKCIAHGVGGTLLQHTKEHRLHTGLGPTDALYFHTTCGWMMWNWQLSALASGAHIVVYDGSVSHPAPDTVIRLLERERVTVFGTSPVYLQYLEMAGVHPAEIAELTALRLLQSTGAVLYPRHYDFVRDRIKAIPVHSISGGTDIIGCFVLGNPNLPVHRGESPCIGLGMDARVLDGGEVRETGVGELVCCAPFPSRPVGFFGDPDGQRLHSAYYAENPGVWTHGDRVALTARGAARILGRSDGILNIKGIRIGPAEIYSALNDVEALSKTMALTEEDPRALGGRRLLLLIVLKEGHVFDRKMMWKLKRLLKKRCSDNHVPERIIAVPELPTTHSGKQSERAAQDLLDKRHIRNRAALRNPEALALIRAAIQTQR